MPWINFDKIQAETRKSKNTGNEYQCHVMYGIKRGVKGEPDAPYEKVLFANQPITVIEKGVRRPGQSIVKFLETANKGDLIVIKNVRNPQNPNQWMMDSIENRSQNVELDYKPLSDEEADKLRAMQQPMQAPMMNAPMMPQMPQMPMYQEAPARPTTPYMAPLNYPVADYPGM